MGENPSYLAGYYQRESIMLQSALAEALTRLRQLLDKPLTSDEKAEQLEDLRDFLSLYGEQKS